jgi:hypothetical protein
MTKTIYDLIDETTENHYRYKSGVIKCIILSEDSFEELEKELSKVQGFKYNKLDILKYKGIDTFVAKNLKGKKVLTY